jgi:hypothetical protein
MASTTATNSEPGSELRRLRLRQVNRHDVVSVPARLEDLIPQDHLARLIWGVLESLDLSPFYADIKVFEGEPGAPAIDPKILIGHWVRWMGMHQNQAKTTLSTVKPDCFR